MFQKVQTEFPNATVVASTFDDWLDAVEGSGLVSSLPVVTQEVRAMTRDLRSCVDGSLDELDNLGIG